MRTLFCGNMANVGYMIAKQLREYGYDQFLLMEKNPLPGSDPKNFDSSICDEYPDWIIFYDKNKPSWKRDLIRIMRDKQFDLLHTQVELPIFAYLSRRPFLSHIMGSDLRELAFSNSLKGILLRRSYRRSKAILYGGPGPYSLLSKLKLKNTIFLPMLNDISFFKSQIVENKFNDKFIIFHPTNLEWRLKGNEIFIKGFAEFVKKFSNSLLIIVDRGIDSQKSHDLVNKLGINENILFLNGQLTASELLYYYNLSDVVVDDFIINEIGGIGREALSCEKPLITLYDELGYEKLFGEPCPALNASSASEISHKLEFLQDKKIRIKIGKSGRDWIIKHSSPSVFTHKLTIIYDSILNKKPLEEIRDSLSEI